MWIGVGELNVHAEERGRKRTSKRRNQMMPNLSSQVLRITKLEICKILQFEICIKTFVKIPSFYYPTGIIG